MDPGELDAYLDRVLIGDREPGPVTLAEWDPAWSARFERERDRIRQALGEVARRVEHIGSTAVAGLAAKPVVDILVTVPDVDDEGAFVEALLGAGYVLRVREPGHRLFRTPEMGVHVHVLADSDPEADRYLMFRDRLRSSAEDRIAYERLKRELVPRDWYEIGHYAEAKGPLLRRSSPERPALEPSTRPTTVVPRSARPARSRPRGTVCEWAASRYRNARGPALIGDRRSVSRLPEAVA